MQNNISKYGSQDFGLALALGGILLLVPIPNAYGQDADIPSGTGSDISGGIGSDISGGDGSDISGGEGSDISGETGSDDDDGPDDEASELDDANDAIERIISDLENDCGSGCTTTDAENLKAELENIGEASEVDVADAVSEIDSISGADAESGSDSGEGDES